MSFFTPYARQLYNWLETTFQLAVSVRVDDKHTDGWSNIGRYPHDRDLAETQKLYTDSLTAWRKNPLAWRIIQITNDYVVGEGITIGSPLPHLQKFIEEFWTHQENHMALRLESMCDELSRSGDLFPLLFRNAKTGMSYIRFLTKDQIQNVETKPNDWEKETSYQTTSTDLKPQTWHTPHSPRAKRSQAIALHYKINSPIGATFGEGDLSAAIPWLLKYSRLLEDRVRLHWALRAFLWFVKAPPGKWQAKAEQYKTPPEFGSVVVLEDGEEWRAEAPVLSGSEPNSDMKAIRQMIDAASGYPPHWRGEATDVNLATAQAMQEPAERHLIRRQDYFIFILQDILYYAYTRASEHSPETYPALTTTDYKKLFTATRPDISRTDNAALAEATSLLTRAIETLNTQYPNSPTLKRLLLRLAFKFAGEAQPGEVIDTILKESKTAVSSPTPTPSANGRHHKNGVPTP